MCTSEADAQLLAFKPQEVSSNTSSVVSMPSPAPGLFNPAFLEYQRLQLLDYGQASRLRIVPPGLFSPYAGPFNPYNAAAQDNPFGFPPFLRFDPRSRFVHEEPKPQHSYIGLIAMAILSSVDKKMVLSDIYQYILDHYPYFRNRGPGWRNSIRHNLSLNDCFVKAGRSANGKGHYWAIHPANIEDFKKGDFRRRKAQRKVRKHMGLSVPDDDDSPTPTPPPQVEGTPATLWENTPGLAQRLSMQLKRRQFDVESLLAPEPKRDCDSPVSRPEEPSTSPDQMAHAGPVPKGGSWLQPCHGLTLSSWTHPASSLLAIHQQRLSMFRPSVLPSAPIQVEEVLQRWCTSSSEGSPVPGSCAKPQ
ncbi:forkhead box protein E3-like [Ornithodoros turicata]|uniref:forkhead box protein E3-like n=1 Tax=Ornithodoros turicata TaxID=34597 RepID=UPI003139A693